MILKESRFAATNEYGPTVLPLFNRATDAFFEKTASHFVVPEVLKYIETVRPENDACYTLVNALGASEFYSSNSNADAFPESSLIHRPDRWTGNPLLDASVGKQWAYGFPTFYGAHAYPHHRNKDPNKSLGDVTFVCWNDRMKRVELVTRVTKDRCLANGGQAIWDKLQSGQYAEVSMGSRVPGDLCFTSGTLVRTSTGNVRIEDVRLGDLVLTHKGRYRPVTQLFRNPGSTVVDIVTRGLPAVSATDNHPFLVIRGKSARTCIGSANGRRLRHKLVGSACKRCKRVVELRPEWVAAKDIVAGDYMLTPLTPTDTGAVRPPSGYARLLGYYLGDGCVDKQRTGRAKKGPYRDMGVSISAGTAEGAHIDRVFKALVDANLRNFPRVHKEGSKKAVRIVVSDQRLAAWLREFGGSYSHSKRLHEGVFSWCDEDKLELLAGYIDTDGSFSPKTGMVRISSVNRGLLLDTHRLLLTMGIHASVGVAGYDVVGGFSGDSPTIAWQVTLPASSAQRFLGRTVKVLPRAINWASPSSFFYGEWFATPIQSVRPRGVSEDVFNLSVEEDESYIAEGRVSHNCSICTDWDAYRKAKATFDPKRHPYEGAAVLEYHKKHPIKGWAITRKDYCEHMLKTPNKILPDGRKVFVYNDYPRFFDISYVFIGADKTAKTLMHLSRPGMISSPSDAFIKKAAQLFPGMDKTAAATPKTSAVKSSEMYKEDIPSQFVPAAVATVTRRERDLPDDMLHRLSDSPLESMLATLGSAGVVLRPREFQRVVLIQGGMEDLADKLDSRGSVFPRCSADPDFHLSHGDILPDVVKEILPFLSQRSALKEPLHIRVVISSGAEPPPVKTAAAPSLLSEPLRKISSRYTAYRSQLMETLSHAPTFLSFASDTGIGGKVASKLASELFSPLTVGYIQSAFWDEVAPPPLLNGQEPA